MSAVYDEQGKRRGGSRQAWGVLAPAAMLVALAGCEGGGGALGPAVDAFYGLEGGAIAAQRPPPPGADDPYPSLGSVPARPAAPDVAAQQRIADRLATQRDEAQAAAAQSPITALPPPPATPKPTAPDPNANRVSVDAAATPPAAKGAPASTPAAVPPIGIGAVPAVPAAVASGPVPSLADAPPATPAGFGVGAPAPAPAAPPALPPASAPANTVQVEFTPGSSVLPPSAPLNLRRFALAHRGVPITVTGHGGDVLPGADPQSRALDLALRRAQAMAASLGAAGVPAANVRLRAEAAGQGGGVSL